MAVKCSSSSARKASLVLMLLFGTVVAAHAAVEVEIHNDTCMDIKVNGTTIGAGFAVKVTTNASYIVLSVTDAEGKVVSANYSVPPGGCKFRVVCRGGKVYVELVACKVPVYTLPDERVGKVDVSRPNCTC